MKKTIKIFMKFLFGVIGIVLISATPALFGGAGWIDLQSYLTALQEVLISFVSPNDWALTYLNPVTFEPARFSFSAFLSGPYLYSMPILLLALGLALVLAFLMALLTLLSKGQIRRRLLDLAKILQSFPDFAFVFIIQIVVLTIYEKTGTLIFSFYSLGDERVYLAPVLCLSVLPTLLFFKLFLLLYEAELERPYVELARSKGLSRFEVLWTHCTSNVLRSAFYQSKSIVWLTLSSLLIIEYLFGIDGILYYLQSDFSPKGISFILLTIFVPFFAFYTALELFLERNEIERNMVFEKFNLRLFDTNELRTGKMRLFSGKQKEKSAPFLRLKIRPSILIPSFIVVGLLMASLLYAAITGDQVEQINYVYDDEGGIESSAPHPPSSAILFGTDPFGYSIAQQLLVGIKYTITLCLVIATLRVAAGYLFGIIYTFFLSTKARNFVNSMADGMHFLPLTLLVFILLIPVLITSGEWDSTFTERLVYQILIMTVIVLPVTTSAIGNEINESMKKEYVLSSVLMGSSLSWILAKHIQPQIWSKLLLMWVQHIIQVLQMFIHLGILSVFVGGALSQSDSPRLIPEIYELSGMIAISREVFVTNQYWMILPPLAIFMVLIYCFTMIAESLIHKQLPPFKSVKEKKLQESQNLISSFNRIDNSKVTDEAN